MVTELTPAGLTIDSVNEIIASLTASLQAIYGTDINVDSNSPDGQLINLYSQSAADILEVLLGVYNSFAVSGAYGSVLDQRVALNGIVRRQGTYTTTPVLVVVNQALTLYGQDQTAQPVFTIADGAGNQFQLMTTMVFGAAGNAILEFKAVAIGQIEVTANTITNFVTTVIGVTSVNNPAISINTTCHTSSGSPILTSVASTAGMVPGLIVTGTGIPVNTTIVSVDSSTQITVSQNATATASGVSINAATPTTSVGVNEETDAQLKVREAQSFALAATGPADAVSAALQAVADITDAYVVENPTGNEVATVPAHSIWCIVTGGTDAEIAQAIYAKKGIGCGMKGSESFSITRPNGTAFIALWDVSIPQPLYIEFTIVPRTVGQSFDTALVAQQLAAALVYKLGQNPTIGDIVNAMAIIAPTSYQVGLGVSSNGSDFFDVIVPSSAQHYFTVNSANVAIST